MRDAIKRMEDRLADLHELVWTNHGKRDGDINLHALNTYKCAVFKLQEAGIPISEYHSLYIKRYEEALK